MLGKIVVRDNSQEKIPSLEGQKADRPTLPVSTNEEKKI